MTITTLVLSMGATREAGQAEVRDSSKARKGLWQFQTRPKKERFHMRGLVGFAIRAARRQ